ncbi:fimbrial biogenesis chaperone [Novosphingobium cyanobacteriorum]|uniref:Fimbria/pilus periplasmic chaperone n=1 Tax=Novosphingobium cyanobacteriorum TaxID=3024215 RepID=A0ABT6CMA0_9SPHN|nr:fimbria/pilus periplasmic chaperone [Novosphingobium cyanobacteriorum]MDF8335049.1 fimbria/pilus periplasmic chaperone [Novosphingobium cyanobacteriorum]
MNRLLSRIAFATAACASFTGPALATSVSPLSLELQSTGRKVVANIQVVNDGAKPLPVEAVTKVLTASADGFAENTEETEDLLVMPPNALIPPGQTQAFRVQWVGDPAPAESKHYYVSINELPVKLPDGQSALQILYNFKVLVSVGLANGKGQLAVSAASIGQNKDKPAPVVTVSNTGTTYDYLSQHALHLVEKDAKGTEVFNRTVSGNEFAQLVGFGLVATGQQRSFTLPIELPTKDGTLTATLVEERGE